MVDAADEACTVIDMQQHTKTATLRVLHFIKVDSKAQSNCYFILFYLFLTEEAIDYLYNY